MSTPGGEQPVGQLSPDGRWRWDGHNWVPTQQSPAPQQPYQGQQPPAYQQAPYPHQFPGQPYAPQQYGGLPPGTAPPKKGLPTWAKVLIIVLSLIVALMVLLTIVGLAVDEDYSSWSCDDVAAEAVRISDDNEGVLILTEVTDLKVVEDNREDFTAPENGRGVVLTCEGTGKWDSVDDTPVIVELAVDNDGDEWVRYEMTD
jgi:hypothetical protein